MALLLHLIIAKQSRFPSPVTKACATEYCLNVVMLNATALVLSATGPSLILIPSQRTPRAPPRSSVSGPQRTAKHQQPAEFSGYRSLQFIALGCGFVVRDALILSMYLK